MPLWAHQSRGVGLLHDRDENYIAWDMGTGKSRTVVEAIRDSDWQRAVIVSPKQVIDGWREEFELYADKELIPIPLESGSVRKRTEFAETQMKRFDGAARGVLILNYESAWREPMASYLASKRWPLVVCDEGHRIKSPSGKASWYMKRLGKLAERRSILSGTPMPHSPLDLYAQFRFLAPRVFGTNFTSFRSRYAVMGGYQNHQVLRFQNLDEMNERFYSVADRVTKRDVLDLPPVSCVHRMIELSPSTRRVYREMEDNFVADVKGGVIVAGNALVRLLRLSQIANGFASLHDSAKEARIGNEKQAALTEYFEDLQRDEPVVVFCRFHHDLDDVRLACENVGRRYLELSGRRKQKKEFIESDDGSVIAIQIGAGGEGVNGLQWRCCYGVFFSVGWSLGEYDQAISRLDRAGQERPVTFTHLVSEGTIDQEVYKAFKSRAEVIESVLTSIGERG